MSINPLIQSVLPYRPSDAWILANSGLAWLELDIDIPYQEISQEASQVFYQRVEHRDSDSVLGYGNQGWHSLCLHGESATATSSDQGPMTWTDIGNVCPQTRKFIERYWIMDQAGRIRYMWLMPNGYILPHVDREGQQLFECNIAINHPDNCRVQFLDHGTIPFEAGKGFIIDTSRRHFAVNQSQDWRLHLIVHAPLKPGVVRQSYEKSFYS